MTNETARAAATVSSIPAEQLRLLLRVARLYHERGVRQPAIAAQLNLSQARVSRLLKLAGEVGIVRTIVVPPAGTNTDIERALEEKFQLSEVVVVDVGTDAPASLLTSLGGAAAAYLTTALRDGEHVGLSSWSETLIATVAAMRPASVPRLSSVVQIIGGLGAPGAQPQATRLVGRLADLSGATPIYLPAPGLLGSKQTRQALLEDPSITAAQESWNSLSTVIVGIGSIDPSPLLQESGNAVPPAELEQLREHAAAGDVCLRFFDDAGDAVRSDLDERVLGISEEQLRAVPRRVGVAGGIRKVDAIRAAMRGGWVNVLVTDAVVAEQLLAG